MVEGVTCGELLAELEEKLETKLGVGAQQAPDVLADLLTFLRLVAITGTVRPHRFFRRVGKKMDRDVVHFLVCSSWG